MLTLTCPCFQRYCQIKDMNVFIWLTKNTIHLYSIHWPAEYSVQKCIFELSTIHADLTMEIIWSSVQRELIFIKVSEERRKECLDQFLFSLLKQTVMYSFFGCIRIILQKISQRSQTDDNNSFMIDSCNCSLRISSLTSEFW